MKTIVSEEDLIWGTNISEDFTKDELGTVTGKPEVMLYVKNTQEISKIMKYANEHYIPVVVRGSGTGLVGACVPLYGGIIINTSKMNKILELDEANLTLTVEPGVLLMEIYDYVEPKDIFMHQILEKKVQQLEEILQLMLVVCVLLNMVLQEIGLGL